MSTLRELIARCQTGERPDYDDLRLAVAALGYIVNMDASDGAKIMEGLEDGASAGAKLMSRLRAKEVATRPERSLGSTPAHYLGKSYNPDDPAVAERIRAQRADFGALCDTPEDDQAAKEIIKRMVGRALGGMR